ncbi:hypothetical protein ACG2F4_08915 [Halalkalibaculum sp. DA3122]|uniref:alpha/beta fold hydrolase n=1 Tax=unclassified Halalkalibaculum TaxID=2964617 RepID=UPI003754538F
MKDSAQLVAWHGWAFDRTCWEPWENVLPDQILLHPSDRGYWGDPLTVKVIDDQDITLVFTHSYGLHLCPGQQLAQADMVVIFGGFREFHPVAAQFNRRSKLILNKMIQSLEEDPEPVLQQFMENAYKPEQPPEIDSKKADHQQLLHDLRALNQSSLDIQSLKKGQNICILHGSSDAIVPKTKGRELYNIFQENATYFEVRGAGHALPFTHVEQCWAFIQPEIEKLFD